MILENIDLKPFNTFGIHAIAKKFATFSSVEELNMLLNKNDSARVLILGGGSNILFTQDFDGLVLRNEIKGFKILDENDEFAIVQSGAGEIWHQFVLKCIDLGYGGIENLSLIPGSVGASPMQNIGAYGVEIKDVFYQLEAYHIPTGEVHTFDKESCAFGYRESVFKHEKKGQYVILSVSYKLSKIHELHTKYGVIENELVQMGIQYPTIKNVSDAVIAIRSSKLPDPIKIGNAGSFFKNPVVETSVLDDILINYADVPSYPAGDGKVKLAAGWLIEKAGWKGKTFDGFGVHKNQALVLVNYGGSEGQSILQLSTDIIEDISNKFGVILEREVNIF